MVGYAFNNLTLINENGINEIRENGKVIVKFTDTLDYAIQLIHDLENNKITIEGFEKFRKILNKDVSVIKNEDFTLTVLPF